MILVREGLPKYIIENELKPPIKPCVIDNKTKSCLYQYISGNPPSPDRSSQNFILDILTLCAWELIATPVEAFRGTKHLLKITYDSEEIALKIETVDKIK